jgi:hypothetical protein
MDFLLFFLLFISWLKCFVPSMPSTEEGWSRMRMLTAMPGEWARRDACLFHCPCSWMWLLDTPSCSLYLLTPRLLTLGCELNFTILGVPMALQCWLPPSLPLPCTPTPSTAVAHYVCTMLYSCERSKSTSPNFAKRGMWYYCSHFTEEETKAQEHQMIHFLVFVFQV